MITKKIYAVIDTNVLVSAMLSKHSDSATVRVIDLFFDDKIVPLVNEEILKEYNDVLHRKKFHFPTNLINTILQEIRLRGIMLDRTKSTLEFPDPKDVVFYEVALSKDGSFLVTGNTKHFPSTPIVVTPAEFLKICSAL